MIETQTEPPEIEALLKEMSEVVSSVDDSQRVLDSLAQLVAKMLRVEICSLMLLDVGTRELRIRAGCGVGREVMESYRGKVGEGIAGWVARHGRALLIDDVENHPTFGRKSREKYSTKSLLSVPLRHRGRVLGVLNVNNKQNGEVFTQSDELLLGVVANFVVITLERARMRDMMLEKQRLDAELRVAFEIQQRLFPQQLPADEGYQFAVRCLPALQVSGDFFDIIDLPGDKMCIVLGDVCGKGIPAALYMARVLTYFRAIAHVKGTADLLLASINELLTAEWTERTFVTACLAVLDKKTATVSVFSAGHPPPYFLRADAGAIECLDVENGFPLGVVPGAEFSIRQVSLSPNDCLVMYTDGITEAKGAGEECFGGGRLQEIVRGHQGSADYLAECIINSVVQFAQGRAQSDDQTLVILRKV